MNIFLSTDEALVLFEFFARFRETNKFSLRNNSEYIAFSRIAGQLERTLIEPFQPNYKELLQQAENRIGKGYEGIAPGVNP
jgi:hypothetical protein